MVNKQVRVAVAVIVDAEQRVLIALRQAHQHQGGLWEFPGGKVESGEQVEAAVRREIQEEVNLTVELAEPLIEIEHSYADKAVILDVWFVTQFSGLAIGQEGQQVQWCPIEALGQYEFPEANKTIIECLKTRLAKGTI